MNMEHLDERTLLFAIHQLKGIGWKSIDLLMQSLSSLTQIWTLSLEELTGMGIDEKLVVSIKQQISIEVIQEYQDEYAKRHIHFMTRLDEDYPKLLEEIPQPPWVLYYQGDIQLLHQPLIAIVGTRVPTMYGKKMAEVFAADLASRGVGIVSGLARGIDSLAHQGALNSPHGKTIAVTGTGLDRIYPKENVLLYEAIANQGLIITETPLKTAFHPGLFPIRNRIIAGLCLGTFVIEAAEKSGSLITADQALEQCRDVFALPGPVNSPKSTGCLRLIQQGAKCVITVDDILEEYTHNVAVSSINIEKDQNGESHHILTNDERMVLDLMSHEPISFDEIFEKCKFEFGHLHSVLLNLLMKNMINQLPGSTYIKQ